MALNHLEATALETFRRGTMPKPSGDAHTDWVALLMVLALRASRTVRSSGLAIDRGSVDFKGDGSPATDIERDVESSIREAVSRFDPTTAFVGEETGGALPTKGFALGVDPVDGTWAFVTGTETYATTLTLFEDGEAVIAVIANPQTGELGYATPQGEARLLRLSAFGSTDSAITLPGEHADDAPVLVNLHPSRSASALVNALYAAWSNGVIRMVRSPGGSPAWALLEAARGRFVYVNMWSKRPAAPYDLAGGVLVVRRAGGEVVGLDGAPIDAVRHAGPFVASIDPGMRLRITEIMQRTME